MSALTDVIAGHVLDRERARIALSELLAVETNARDVCWGALFAAVKHRGNALDETKGFVDAVLAYDRVLSGYVGRRRRLALATPVVSLTGSGKEGFKTFNVSTCTAFVVAACGVAVVKPGSRALSAVSGATDVLELLGVPLAQGLDEVEPQLQRDGICFFDFGLVAPRYARRYGGRFVFFHPLSYVLPAVCIPFELDALLYGIADDDVVHSAEMIRHAGHRRGAVVTTSLGGWGRVDELLSVGVQRVARFDDGGVTQTSEVRGAVVPTALAGLAQCDSHLENANRVVGVLSGTAPPAAIDAVVENAALLLVAGEGGEANEATIARARARAIAAIDSGAAVDLLRRVSRARRGAR